jgi:hypothetical protein
VPASKGAVKVDGVREVQRALKALEADAADLKTAHLAVSTKLLPGVTQRTPRRSGALAAGWHAGSTKTRARITNTERYAGPIEYGWPAHGIEPARMVRDTVDASSREILDTYETELARLGAAAGFDTKT